MRWRRACFASIRGGIIGGTGVWLLLLLLAWVFGVPALRDAAAVLARAGGFVGALGAGIISVLREPKGDEQDT